jgi:hypothetical protein
VAENAAFFPLFIINCIHALWPFFSSLFYLSLILELAAIPKQSRLQLSLDEWIHHEIASSTMVMRVSKRFDAQAVQEHTLATQWL